MNEIRDDAEIRYLGDVQRLALKPDDLIVISCERRISDETAQRIKDLVAASLPGRKVLVISEMRLTVLSPEPADRVSERDASATAHAAVYRAIRSEP